MNEKDNATELKAHIEPLETLFMEKVEELKKDYGTTKCFANAMESSLSAANHERLVREEETLQLSEIKALRSLTVARNRLDSAYFELAQAQSGILFAYQSVIVFLDNVRQQRKEMHDRYEELSANQEKQSSEEIKKQRDSSHRDEKASALENTQPQSAAPESNETTAATATEELNTVSGSCSTNVRDWQQPPELKDFITSDYLKARIEILSANSPMYSRQKIRNVSVASSTKTDRLAMSIQKSNPFDHGKVPSVTPGMFGRDVSTETPVCNEVSSSIKKFREGVKPESSYHSDAQKAQAQKNSKGSLNGSFIAQSPSPIKQFAGRIPMVDFDASTADETTTFVSPRFTASMKKPKLPILVATDQYDAARLFGPVDVEEKENEPKLAVLNPLPKPITPPIDTNALLFGTAKDRPKTPVLHAADLLNVQQFKQPAPVRIGQSGAFKPVDNNRKVAGASPPNSQQSNALGGQRCQEAFQNYRRSVTNTAPVNETFVLKKERPAESARAAGPRKPIALFGDEEYRRLPAVTREKIDLERLNEAIRKFNAFAKDNPVAEMCKETLRQTLCGHLDSCEFSLFTSALTGTGRLHKKRTATTTPIVDQTVFE